MTVSIPRSLVEHILLGPTGDRRQLQESPILGDVWIAFAKEPSKPQELLITPHNAQTAGKVAIELNDLIAEERKSEPREHDADIAYLQGIVAARLYFDEILRVVVPTTEWWISPRNKKEMQPYERHRGSQRLSTVLNVVNQMLLYWSDPTRDHKIEMRLSALDRYAALAGIICWAKGANVASSTAQDDAALAKSIADATADIARVLTALFSTILRKFPAEEKRALVYQISLNRHASVALSRSIPAVKADAARTLFTVNTAKIAWAVIDSGIQGDHAAFKGTDCKSRVKRSFDFSNFRKIVSLDNLKIFAEGADKKVRAERLKICFTRI